MSFVSNYFMLSDPEIVDNDELREPQVLAYLDAYKHFVEDKSTRDAVIVLPTGAGKTGVMALVPYGISTGRVLIITPQLVIKDHVVESLDPSVPSNFWLERKVFSSYEQLPIVTEFDNNTLLHELENSNIVILNIHKLSSQFRNSLLKKVAPDFFDMIIIDEAHHSPATTWRTALEYFKNAKVVKVTGTPFRTDRKPIEGKVVTDYRLGRAMQLKIVKSLENFRLIPDELYLTIDEDENRRYTVQEIIDLGIKDEDYVHRSVALSPECNNQIIDEAIKVWKSKKEGSSVPHKIIAVACSIYHAEKLQELFHKKGVHALVIHSDLDKPIRSRILADVENHRCDAIIHVAMLGEGYDHTYLSVAAIFRPYKSLAPYSQFIGRVLRKVPDSEVKKPSDNIATVIAHSDLGLDALWKEYHKEMKICSIIEEVKKKERSEKKLDRALSGKSGAYDKSTASIEVSEELTIEADHYIVSDLIIENQKFEEELMRKINLFKESMPELGEEEVRKFLLSQQKPAQTRPELKNPKKYRMLIRERFHNRIYEDLPAHFIAHFEVEKEGREFANALPPKYKWIGINTANDNAAIISIYFNTRTKEQFGARETWRIDDYYRAEEYLDSLVEHTLDVINSILGKE